MSKIRDATQIIAMLERGDLASELTNEITRVLAACREQSGAKQAAKGSITLTLAFSVQGPSVEIEGSISAKTPKNKRGRSIYFVTDDGELSTEHPQQLSMLPREVARTQQG
jgi:hypothetical protein